MTQKTCIHDRDRKHRQVYIDRWTGTGKGNVDRDRGQVYRWTGTGACNVDIPSFGSMGSGASVVSKRAHYIWMELPAMAAAMRSNAAPMATAGPSTTAGPSNATLMAIAGPSNAAPVFPPHPSSSTLAAHSVRPKSIFTVIYTILTYAVQMLSISSFFGFLLFDSFIWISLIGLSYWISIITMFWIWGPLKKPLGF